MAPSQAGHAPTLEKFLKSLKGQPLEASIENLASLLKRRQIKGPEPCAMATAHILLQVVAKSRYSDVDQLLDHVHRTGKKLVASQPRELVIGNIVRRVLGLIRDEAEEDRNGIDYSSDSVSDIQPLPTAQDFTQASQRSTRPPTLPSYSSFTVPKSMFNLLSGPVDSTGSPFSRMSGSSTPVNAGQAASVHALRSEVIDGIEEIKDEISQVDDQIATFADIQIHPGDYILVYRPTRTVERFLAKAAKRRFTVLVAGQETSKAVDEAPFASFRKKLTSLGIKVINISNVGLTAYMPKVNKVIFDAKAVVANGGVIADAGASLVARAARAHDKLVVVLSGIYRVCPEDPFDLEALVEWGDPSTCVDFADGVMVNGVAVESATAEFVVPELIDFYITNLGPHSREHLHGIIAEHYKVEDDDFLP